MFRPLGRLVLFASLFLVVVAAPAAAQDLGPRVDDPAPVVAQVFSPAPSRPSALVPLYISFATLEALDIHSTLTAVDAGAREANPIAALAGRSPAAMIALKAGTGAGMIYATERLWKRNRVAAVALMVGMNGAYAIVVAHNYSVAARARSPR